MVKDNRSGYCVMVVLVMLALVLCLPVSSALAGDSVAVDSPLPDNSSSLNGAVDPDAWPEAVFEPEDLPLLERGFPGLGDNSKDYPMGIGLSEEPDNLHTLTLEQLDPVYFPDPKLEAVVRIAIGKPTGVITRGDMAELTSLIANSKEITNLTGLEYAINLLELNLEKNAISDLAPLAGLTTLGILRLSNNPFSDLSPLSQLIYLANLTIMSNKYINDFSILPNLANLQILQIGSSSFSDLTLIQNLANLQVLNLAGTAVTDFSPLANLHNLHQLIIQNSGIDDQALVNIVTAVQNKTIEFLYLGANRISNIAPLQNLTHLKYLNLNNNQISEITALQSLTFLQKLYLESNLISDLAPLTGLINLNELDLDDNLITDIAPLVANNDNGGLGNGDSVNLQYNYLDLNLGSQALTDIQTLSYRGVYLGYQTQWPTMEQPELPVDIPDTNLESAVRTALGRTSGAITRGHLARLTSLNASKRGITDLTGLEYAVNLEQLRLYGNQISDNTALVGLTSLRVLDLETNKISDITKLADLQSLIELRLGGNQITDISPLVTNSNNGGLGYKDQVYLKNNYLDLSIDSPVLADIQTLLDRGVYLEYQPQMRMVDNPELKVDFTDPNLEAAVRAALLKGNGDITRGDLAGLTSLEAIGKGINTLTGLEYAVNLQYLYLISNQVSDISLLAGLTNLQILQLWNNQISDVSPLTELNGLQWLGLGYNHIRNIIALAKLNDLKSLYLDNNQISDFSLVNLNIEFLNLSFNQISDIAALEQLTNLKSLELNNNRISDISPLASLALIQKLTLNNNNLTDIGPLVSSQNSGLGAGDYLDLDNNYLDLTLGSKASADIQTLHNRGVNVYYQRQRRPVANLASVAIDNSDNARPQAGLDQADIVYETAVAPGITRYLTVFDLAEPVDKIGPVRSAREHLVGLAGGHGGGFAHAGGDSFSLAELPKVPVVNLDEIYGSSSYFYRATERAMPHNLYTNSSLLQQGLAASGQPLAAPADPIPRGEMAGGDHVVGASAWFPGYSQDTVFQWNATGQYYQRIVNGLPDLLGNNAPITAANVIVLYTDHLLEYQSNLNEWTIKARVEGTGDSLFFRDGKVWAGMWDRSGRDAMFVFTVNGTPMQFAPGNVWVMIASIPGQQTVTIPDPGLNAAVRAALGKPQPWDLTTTDLDQLTYLDASGRKIQDLTGLDQAVNLQYLDLRDNAIRDISTLLNTDFGSGITINLRSNYLDLEPNSDNMVAIQEMVGKGVTVDFRPQLGGVVGKLKLQAR